MRNSKKQHNLSTFFVQSIDIDPTYISNDERKFRKAKQIDNSGIFFETNLSSKNIISFIKDLLLNMNLDTDDFSFSLSEVPFDINDENTWEEGMLPVAKLTCCAN